MTSPSGISHVGAPVPPPLGMIVTGASGWLGRHVVERLLCGGWPVVSVGRTAPASADVRHFSCDLACDSAAIPSAMSDVLPTAERWVVIHCAGLAHIDHLTPAMRDAFQRVNVDGTARLLDACRSLGVTRFVHVSSTAVYGWHLHGEPCPRTEDAPARPETPYGESKLAGERLVASSSLDWRIARLATVFGEGDRANFSRLAVAINRRRFVLPGSGAARKSCIPVALAAQCLCQMAILESMPYRLLNLALPTPPTLLEICAAVAQGSGLKPPPSLPIWVLATAARFGDALNRLGLRAPLDSSALAKLTTATWVDASRAAELFPEVGQSSFAAAMKDCMPYYARLR